MLLFTAFDLVLSFSQTAVCAVEISTTQIRVLLFVGLVFKCV